MCVCACVRSKLVKEKEREKKKKEKEEEEKTKYKKHILHVRRRGCNITAHVAIAGHTQAWLLEAP